MAQAPPRWQTCDQRGDGGRSCTGIRAGGFARCLAHLESEELDRALSRLRPGATVDARGTTLSLSLVGRILDAVRDESGPVLGDARFTGATFLGHTNFNGARFTGDAEFDDATFEWAGFGNVTFDGYLTTFVRTTVTAGTWFPGASFSRFVSFADASLAGAEFVGVTFPRGVRFSGARFVRRAGFAMVTVAGSPAEFDGATFDSEVTFDRAKFEATEVFGPVVAPRVALSHAVFTERVLVEVAAAEFVCEWTRFDGGVTLRLRHATAELGRAVFGGPSAITLAERPATELVAQAETELGLGNGKPAAPVLASLEGVDAADLVVTDVDLGPCRFAGAHHLDKLRLEGDCRFALPPRRVRFSWTWPPVWWWTRRQVLAEECDRRAAGRKRAGWPSSTTPLNAKRVAALYRDLRKAQEDSKNEPGAADFYFGEMEMRRADRSTAWPERLVLFLYWLTAGYGLRALRSLACLAVLILVATILLRVNGFVDHPVPRFGDSLLYCVQFTVSLDRATMPRLTGLGETIRVIMRVLGPLLLGLSLLAIRNRVKR